jgi:hypothetical protein
MITVTLANIIVWNFPFFSEGKSVLLNSAYSYIHGTLTESVTLMV